MRFRMDVDAFIAAAEIDDVLVQVMTMVTMMMMVVMMMMMMMMVTI